MGYCSNCWTGISDYHSLCSYCYEKEQRRREAGTGCFITSACVSSMDLPDDCYELETLRSFRDNTLLGSDEGKRLVKHYYHIAPQIVERIEEDPSKMALYKAIYRKIRHILQLIEHSKDEEAIREYGQMVEDLQQKYCVAS